MTATPFISVSTYRIKDGRLEDFRQFLGGLFDVLEPNVPGLLAVAAYLNHDGSEAAIIQVHSDASSIKQYWKVLHQHTGREIAELVDATSTDVYGDPSGLVLERTRHSPEAGVRVSVKPEHLGGFIRLEATAGARVATSSPEPVGEPGWSAHKQRHEPLAVSQRDSRRRRQDTTPRNIRGDVSG